MSKETDAIIQVLSEYVGNSSSFYLAKEMKALSLDQDLLYYSLDKRKALVDNICKNVLSHILSPNRVSVLKVKLQSILQINSRMQDVRGIDWIVIK